MPALQPILPSAIHERERSDCIRPGFPSKALVQVRRLMRRAVRARKKSAELRAHSSHQRICTSSEGLWVPIQVVYVYIGLWGFFFIRGCAVWTFRSADGENAASYPFWFRFGALSDMGLMVSFGLPARSRPPRTLAVCLPVWQKQSPRQTEIESE